MKTTDAFLVVPYEKTTISQDCKIQCCRGRFSISGFIVYDCPGRQRQFFHGNVAVIACNDGIHGNIFVCKRILVLSHMDQ